jgi:PAS domain
LRMPRMLQPQVESGDGPGDGRRFGAWTGYRVPADRSSWHPLARRLYDYWLETAPAPGRLPGRQHVVPEEVAPLWSRMWMIDVSWPLRFRYRYCGSELVRAAGSEVTGRWLDEVHPQLISNPLSRERFRFTAMTARPTWRRGPPLWTRDSDRRTIESCIVPLASDGARVDKMLGVTVTFDRNGHEI